MLPEKFSCSEGAVDASLPSASSSTLRRIALQPLRDQIWPTLVAVGHHFHDARMIQFLADLCLALEENRVTFGVRIGDFDGQPSGLYSGPCRGKSRPYTCAQQGIQSRSDPIVRGVGERESLAQRLNWLWCSVPLAQFQVHLQDIDELFARQPVERR